ncbi:MAG: hypothetical protein ACE5Z5_12830 [Candidatus Bathyarchaeia archaeon]
MGGAEVTIKIGTCGWARLYQAVPASERRGKSNLQAYAEHYPVVEVNSSFYKFGAVIIENGEREPLHTSSLPSNATKPSPIRKD